MGKYTLFGEVVEFTDAEERYLDIINFYKTAKHNADEEFVSWYQKCGDIASVLKGYEKTISNLVFNHAINPLFELLPTIEIYDVSSSAYAEQCLDLSYADNVYNQVVDKYNDIVGEQEAKMEYRAARKANRGRFVGGGFGTDAAIHGMVTAGTLNLASGVGHGIVNTIGNIGSSLVAAAEKSSLYKGDATLRSLSQGVQQAILYAVNSHISLVNDRKKKYYANSFNDDKADALFENAKKVPAKEQDLLIESFKTNPLNYPLWKYILLRFGNERKNVWTICQRFGIYLSNDDIEEALAGEYTPEAQQSEELAQEAKQRIALTMEELNIPESDTFNRLERDCITRLCEGYETADGKKLTTILNRVKKYDALDKNKAAVIYEKRIWQLAAKYHVEFTASEIDKILEKELPTTDPLDRASIESSLCQIKTIMNALHITESSVLDRIEMVCIAKLCEGYELAPEEQRDALLQEIKEYDVRDRNKIAVFREILFWELAEFYQIKFKPEEIETILAREYSDEAKKDETKAQEAKYRMKLIMSKLDVSESVTFDQLEKDCIARLCGGYENISEKACKERLAALRKYDAKPANKEPYINALNSRIDTLEIASLEALCKGFESADEDTCNAFVKAVKSADKKEKNKKVLLNKLQTRIEEIWSAEDGEIFDNLYFNTDITNAAARSEAIRYIKETGRTAATEKYTKALEGYDETKVKRARTHYRGKLPKLCHVMTFSCVFAFVLYCLLLGRIPLASFILVIPFVLFSAVEIILKDAWNLLTVNGTVLHPTVINGIREPKKGIPFWVFCIPVTLVLVLLLLLISK